MSKALRIHASPNRSLPRSPARKFATEYAACPCVFASSYLKSPRKTNSARAYAWALEVTAAEYCPPKSAVYFGVLEIRLPPTATPFETLPASKRAFV